LRDRPALGSAPPDRAASEDARIAAMPAPADEPFEKTIRMLCRLDDSDIEYVRDTAEWIARCVSRVLEIDPSAGAGPVTATVLDMSTLGRWRLMKPETVADQLAFPAAPSLR
jgi:hypothetical protein